MKDDGSHINQTNGKALNWIVAVVVTLITCAIAWVCWTAVDSVQKKAEKLGTYHVTTDNTQVDSHVFEVMKKNMDTPMLVDQGDPGEAFTQGMLKLQGSEIVFMKGVTAVNCRHFAKAVEYYSEVLAMIPQEAKEKTSWRAGGVYDRRTYTSFAYNQRAYCYLKTGSYKLAVADLTAAIKLRPDSADDYVNRAKAYYLIGQKELGDADIKMARTLPKSSTREPLPDWQ